MKDDLDFFGLNSSYKTKLPLTEQKEAAEGADSEATYAGKFSFRESKFQTPIRYFSGDRSKQL